MSDGCLDLSVGSLRTLQAKTQLLHISCYFLAPGPVPEASPRRAVEFPAKNCFLDAYLSRYRDFRGLEAKLSSRDQVGC